ncbi:YqaJ viral recombinase family protein [Bradyrhizobium sp. LjRoot220]|uniref:YqaJ viral recombinase family protein n=1 Tax=Bradyrhizobium sp. LjRoot220 TaxID=3342284 RepID=UPI003ECE232E
MPIERIAVDPSKDRATWLALRQQDITASDVPAICGEGMFGSATKVWAEKLGKVGPQEMTEAMKRGLWGEAAVFEAIGWEYPDWEIRRAKIYLRDTELRLGATPDGAAIIPGLDGVTVIQTKVIARPVFDNYWRADPDDEYSPIVAPLAYQLQTLTETMLADAARAMIVALVVDTFKWSLFTVSLERNAPAEAVIRDRVASFRKNYLETGIQPPVDPERDEQVLKLLFPQDNGIEIDLSHDNELPGLVDSLVNARTEKKMCEDDEKTAKTAIAGKMGEAAIARMADGRRISFKTQHRGSYTVGETDFRVLRILKGKG